MSHIGNWHSASTLPHSAIVVGTRGSALALRQTQFVTDALIRIAPDLKIESRIIKTAGDRDQARPLAEFGGMGVFTKEIEHALLAREIDLAVHSLKDLPADLAPGLVLAAVLERADARDCVISRHGVGLMQLPHGARVGTSSARRAAQLLALRPDLQSVPLRGNVDTRLRQAHSDAYDAIVIAAAGVIRLGRADEITEYLSFDAMCSDPGQGALAVEIRAGDIELASLVAPLDHAPTHAAVTAERAFLRALGGGCRMPIAAYAEMRGEDLHLRGLVAFHDGSQIMRGEIAGDPTRAEESGMQLAENLLRAGAAEILGRQVVGAHAQPLRGCKILITRAREQASVLAEKIRALGGAPIEFPTIALASLEDFRQLDDVLARAGNFDWVVFTSANGVRAVAERLPALNLSTRIFANAKLAAIGPATARALERLGLRADFIPTQFRGEQMALELPIEPGQRALLLRADIASPTLVQGLAKRGVEVTNVEAYHTIMPSAHPIDLKQVDAVTFTSSSSVGNFIAMVGAGALKGVAVFCIGPVTAATAREFGLRVDAVAEEHTLEGLVRALADYYEKTRPKKVLEE